MPKPQVSVNYSAWQLAKKLCDESEEYGVSVKETMSGATLIDAGIKVKGGFLAGKLITEICLGGLGKAEVFTSRYNNLELSSISVYTDHPAIAALGSQFAGWQIRVKDYFAMGSGPARALALKPRELYERIGYADEADVAVLALETAKEPPESVITYISNQCRITPDRLVLILAPTTTVAGSTQISGRVVETGIHKLTKLGLDPKSIIRACGYAPIAPVPPNFAEAMGRTNDAIMYAGVTCYTVRHDDDNKLRELVNKAPSLASKSYGRPFFEIFKEANYDFYQVDPGLFAPAVVIITNAKTGSIFRGGEVNVELFRQSIGF